jgi:hypothetical protein
MSILSGWDKKYCFVLMLLASAGLLIHVKFWLTPSDSLKGDDIAKNELVRTLSNTETL